MTEAELREKILRLITSGVTTPDDPSDVMSEDECVDAILQAFKEAGWKSSVIKVCQGCPDRFEGCVQLDPDQGLPNKASLPTFGEPTKEITVRVPAWWDDVSLVVYLSQVNQDDMLKANFRKIKEG